MNAGELIASAIRDTCRERDIKQYELAIDTGIGTNELSHRMTGKVPFDMDDIDLIAKGLGMTAWDLLSRATE